MFFFHAKGKVAKNQHEKEKKKAVAVELVSARDGYLTCL